MRKLAFCICKNKDADQLHGSREADQRLCFRYTDSTIPLLPKSEILLPPAIFCGCTAGLMWDLVGNPEDQFSHNEAQIFFLRNVKLLASLCMHIAEKPGLCPT